MWLKTSIHLKQSRAQQVGVSQYFKVHLFSKVLCGLSEWCWKSILLFNSGYVSWARQEHAILITALRVRTIIILILQVKNWGLERHSGSNWWYHPPNWNLPGLKPDFTWFEMVFCDYQLLPLLLYLFPLLWVHSLILSLKISSKCLIIHMIILLGSTLVWMSRSFSSTAGPSLHSLLLHRPARLCVLLVQILTTLLFAHKLWALNSELFGIYQNFESAYLAESLR